MEAQRRAAINRCRQRLKNAQFSLAEGEIDVETYKQRKAEAERKLAALEKQVVNPDGVRVNVMASIELLHDIPGIWRTALPDERQALARFLFEDIVYDLDEQRLVNCRLKRWAEMLLLSPGSSDFPNEVP